MEHLPYFPMEQYTLNPALKILQGKRKEAVGKYISQPHMQEYFVLKCAEELMTLEQIRDLEFITTVKIKWGTFIKDHLY